METEPVCMWNGMMGWPSGRALLLPGLEGNGTPGCLQQQCERKEDVWTS